MWALVTYIVGFVMAYLFDDGTSSLAMNVLLSHIANDSVNSRNAIDVMDVDHSGSVGLDEAKVFAGTRFDLLDKSGDATLTSKELSGHIGKGSFSSYDTDQSGSLSKTEFMTAVEAMFKAADPDQDGTLVFAEFQSSAGRDLVKLL